VVPKDHLLRRMSVFVTAGLADLHKQLRPFYSDIGRPSVDPELMIRMLLSGTAMPSGLSAVCARRSSLTSCYRWFCKLDLYETELA
jgi:hypothetical protein